MFVQLRSKAAAAIGLIALSATLSSAQNTPGQNNQNPPVQNPNVQNQNIQNQNQQNQNQQNQRQRYSAVPQGAQQSAHTDAQLAAWLIVDNQNEIALAKLAEERAKSDDVKKLARTMREDHSELLGKLQQFAAMTGGAHQQQGVQPQRDQQQANPQQGNQQTNQNEVRRADEVNNRPAQAADPNNQRQQAGAVAGQAVPQGQQQQGHHGLNFLALKRELGAQCAQTAQRELNQKSGAEFDECFVGMQIGAHYQAIDTMTVFRTHASPALQQALDQGIQSAESHLKHAKQLMKDEKGSNSRSETSSRGDRS